MLKIVNGTLTSLTKSTSTAVKAAAYVARGAELVYNISKLQNFTSSFCESLAAKIAYMEQSLPNLAGIIYQKMQLQLTEQQALKVVELLKRAGFVNKETLEFIPNRMRIIDNMCFAGEQRYHAQLVGICKEVYNSFNQDYSGSIDQLAKDTSSRVSTQLTAMLQNQVVCPLTREALYYPAQTISSKLVGASAELAAQLRYISALDDPAIAAAIGAGDEEIEKDRKDLPEFYKLSDEEIIRKWDHLVST